MDTNPPFGALRFSDGGGQMDIVLHRCEKPTSLTFLVVGLTLIIWMAAYYQLKRKAGCSRTAIKNGAQGIAESDLSAKSGAM